MLPAGSQKSNDVNAWAQRGKTFVDRLRQSLAASPVPPPYSVWYAGLVIEPTDFSGQLSRLQVSLQSAGAAPGSRNAMEAVPRLASHCDPSI